MADYDSQRPIQALVGAVAADIGVRPISARRLKRLLASLNIWFWAIVGLPTLVAGVYYFAVASDQYMSETKFIVRGVKPTVVSTIGALLASSGFSRGDKESAAVEDFIMSRDAVRKLERQNDLRGVFGRPEGDFLARFPGILMRSDFEALYRRYSDFVSIVTSGETGVTTLDVKAFRAQDAQNIARALLDYSEQLINQMNQRARRDALAQARLEVSRITQKLDEIQDQLTAYRIKKDMIDPKSASMSILHLIGQMEAAQANARAQLGEMLKSAPNSPQIPLVKTRIALLDKLLAEQHAKISGANNSVVRTLTTYERLELDKMVAQKGLASAYASLEMARLEAQRQQLYLEPVAQPNLADYPLYPKRLLSFAMVFATCFLVYGLAWLLVASVREHASG
jgi:capsular polysaccharide transport system permease protein